MVNNKKGFTMVELLATIIILGLLATIGVVATNRYLTQSRKKSYKIMSQTVYEATMNCMTEGKCVAPVMRRTTTITTDTLLKYGYLKKLDNPRNNGKDCSGSVVVTNKSSSTGEYQKYTYDVTLDCEGVANNTLTWPDEKTKETSLDEIKYTNSSGNSSSGSSDNTTKKEKIICKRATSLHEEICDASTCNTNYGKGNKVKYGSLGTKGKLKVGDAFDCDVNGDGVFDAETERFYYMSDLANNSNYAVFLYYSNVKDGAPSNNSPSPYGNRMGYNSKADLNIAEGATIQNIIYGENVSDETKARKILVNRMLQLLNYYEQGPVAAKNYLPTTSQWTNVKLYNNKKNIYDQMGNVVVKNFDYSNSAARLLSVQEVETGCGIDFQYNTENLMTSYYCGYRKRKNQKNGELVNKCSFMLENTTFTCDWRGYQYSCNNGTLEYYWLENYQDDVATTTARKIDLKTGSFSAVTKIEDASFYEFHGPNVWAVSSLEGVVDGSNSNQQYENRYFGVRPVIEVAKKNIDYK